MDLEHHHQISATTSSPILPEPNSNHLSVNSVINVEQISSEEESTQRGTQTEISANLIRISNNQQANVNDTGPNGAPIFGVVRDRLFQAMLVRFTMAYSRLIPSIWRRIIEFSCLIFALFLFFLLTYARFITNNPPENCLNSIKSNWPRAGIVRVEVLKNLNSYNEEKKGILDLQTVVNANQRVTNFSLREVLVRGPLALPSPLKVKSTHNIRAHQLENSSSNEIRNKFLIDSESPETTEYQPSLFYRFVDWVIGGRNDVIAAIRSDISSIKSEIKNYLDRKNGEETEENDFTSTDYEDKEAEEQMDDSVIIDFNHQLPSYYLYVVEYSLSYGLIRLSSDLRKRYHIPILVVQIDSEDEQCFGNWRRRLLMRYLIGYDETVMSSVRSLAENETEKGYLRDLLSGDQYHFVTSSSYRLTFLTAILVMLIFTFAISLMLRYSHHQIFLFIIDLLQMFELNQPIVFPVAPLLTVILALVGMESIMSEVFNDTSLAFYVILLVWMADQYDAICCNSPIGKKHWLRFFYIYHFAFYIHQYRYSGHFSGLALTASTVFILHSMIYFFHHYELPFIVYQERLHEFVTDFQQNFVPRQENSNNNNNNQPNEDGWHQQQQHSQ